MKKLLLTFLFISVAGQAGISEWCINLITPFQAIANSITNSYSHNPAPYALTGGALIGSSLAFLYLKKQINSTHKKQSALEHEIQNLKSLSEMNTQANQILERKLKDYPLAGELVQQQNLITNLNQFVKKEDYLNQKEALVNEQKRLNDFCVSLDSEHTKVQDKLKTFTDLYTEIKNSSELMKKIIISQNQDFIIPMSKIVLAGEKDMQKTLSRTKSEKLFNDFVN